MNLFKGYVYLANSIYYTKTMHTKAKKLQNKLYDKIRAKNNVSILRNV